MAAHSEVNERVKALVAVYDGWDSATVYTIISYDPTEVGEPYRAVTGPLATFTVWCNENPRKEVVNGWQGW